MHTDELKCLDALDVRGLVAWLASWHGQGVEDKEMVSSELASKLVITNEGVSNYTQTSK